MLYSVSKKRRNYYLESNICVFERIKHVIDIFIERNQFTSVRYNEYTQRNLFEILLNQTETRSYLPFFDRFGTANGHCPFAVPNKSENGI